MSRRRKILTIALLIMLPIIIFIGTICIGRYTVSPSEVFRSLIYGISGNDSSLSTETTAVVLQIRLPRSFLAVMVGASLAASGAAFQGLFRNPLVSSGILGVSSGSGFGAALAIVFFNNVLLTPFFAFFLV